MKRFSIIQYILDAVENNYLERIIFDSIESSKFLLTAVVSNEQKIQPVLWMIEANMYTKRELLVKNVKTLNNSLEICSFEGITYIINVAARDNKNV